MPASLLSFGIEKNKMNFWVVLLYLWWNMGSSLYTRKQAIVNAAEAHVSSPSPKKFKVQPSAGIRLWRVFFRHSGSCSCGLCASRTYCELNADYYCTLLCDRLWPAVRRKQPGVLNKGVILQHGNAPPHRARQTVEKIEEISPRDFHLDHWKNLLEASSLRIMKMFNNMSYSFYMQPTKTSMLQASADL